MSYTKTTENHSALDTLVNAESLTESRIKDLEEDLKNVRIKLRDAKLHQKELQKTILKHEMKTENMRKFCVECGYVESILN